jgi:excisionase family DNA binding protein
MSILKVLRERTELLTVAELAALMRVADDTIQGWARRQQIPSIRVGNTIRFDGDMLAAWVELQGATTHPIIRPFLHPRPAADPSEYQMTWEDLGELAPEDVLRSRIRQPSEVVKKEAP